MNKKNTKGKILKIENETMTMKYITNNSKNKSMSICFLIKIECLIFQFDIDIHLKLFQCEIIADYQNKTIALLLLGKESKNDKDSIKLTLDTVKHITLDKEKLMCEINESNHIIFKTIKYNIIPYVKLTINNRINLLEVNIAQIFNKIRNESERIKYIKLMLLELKDILIIKSMKYITQDDFNNSIDNNAKEIVSKAKSFIEYFKSIREIIQPQFSFDYSISETQYKSKLNDIVYINNSALKAVISLFPFQLYANNKKTNTEVSFTYKSEEEYLFKCSDSIAIISRESFYYVGIYDNNYMNNSFGFEQGNDYIYIGNLSENKYNGLGLLLTPSFVYRGQFKNGRKNDEKGRILIRQDKIYNGGVIDDCLHGKGIYEYQSDESIFDKIISEWKNNKVEGRSEIVYCNKDSFAGNFNNKPIRKWVYHSNNKNIPEMIVDYEAKPINYHY